MAVSLAYIVNWESKCGANVQARRVLERLDALDGLDVTIVHAADVKSPQNFVGETEGGIDIMYPSSVESGLEELAPDVVLVHSFSSELHPRLREFAEENEAVADTSWVYRMGTNLAEYWMLQARARDEGSLLELTDRAAWFDYIISPSKPHADRIALRYGEDCPEQSVIPVAVDVDSYEPTGFREDGPLRVMVASRIGVNYHHLPVIIACRALAKRGDVTLDLFGGGMEGMAHAMHSLADAYDGVTMHGHVPPGAVKDAMEKADVVCIPSVSQNAVPNTAVEALAAGCFVVAGNSPEMEQVEPAITVHPCDGPQWHDAIETLADITVGDEHISRNVEYAQRFDLDRVIDEGYVPLLEDAAGRNIK